ncbi:MAG: response regulator [Deltaproteobacteria bacterium]|nr:response regulator [Deltaproteobacteria bacterium]
MPPDARDTADMIVIVDDEPRIHDMVKAVLQKAGTADQLNSFFDPVSFIEYLKQASAEPDLILLDVYFENSGLSGVEILPFIRKELPFVPIILLTGMDGAEIEDAQNFEFVYFIPKPVKPEHLVNMVRFYLGLGKKSGKRAAQASRDLESNKTQVQLLKKELAEAEIASWSDRAAPAGNSSRGFQKIIEILSTVLKNCELLPSFTDDIERLFAADFKLFKHIIDTIIRFDITETATPGLNIHKYKGVENVYTLRLTKKARLFFSQARQGSDKKLRLIRIDPEHDVKAMDKWLKVHYDTYSLD